MRQKANSAQLLDHLSPCRDLFTFCVGIQLQMLTGQGVSYFFAFLHMSLLECSVPPIGTVGGGVLDKGKLKL